MSFDRAIDFLFDISEAFNVMGVGPTSGVALWLVAMAIMFMVYWIFTAVKTVVKRYVIR